MPYYLVNTFNIKWHTHTKILYHIHYRKQHKKQNLVTSQSNPETVVCALHTLEYFFFFLFLYSALNFYCSFQSTTSHEFFMIKVLWTTVGIIIIYLTLKVIKKSPYFKLLSWVTQGRLSFEGTVYLWETFWDECGKWIFLLYWPGLGSMLLGIMGPEPLPGVWKIKHKVVTHFHESCFNQLNSFFFTPSQKVNLNSSLFPITWKRPAKRPSISKINLWFARYETAFYVHWFFKKNIPLIKNNHK